MDKSQKKWGLNLDIWNKDGIIKCRLSLSVVFSFLLWREVVRSNPWPDALYVSSFRVSYKTRLFSASSPECNSSFSFEPCSCCSCSFKSDCAWCFQCNALFNSPTVSSLSWVTNFCWSFLNSSHGLWAVSASFFSAYWNSISILQVVAAVSGVPSVLREAFL